MGVCVRWRGFVVGGLARCQGKPVGMSKIGKLLNSGMSAVSDEAVHLRITVLSY